MDHEGLYERVSRGQGFIAALDQSGGSTPKALRSYGIADDQWGSEDEMFALIHEMRSRIIRSPAFTGDKVLGAILFERTMEGAIDDVPVPQALRSKNIVPFLKIDRGLEEEENGVQLMKPIHGLDRLLPRAKEMGVFGTKERSVINAADPTGIAAVVAQQFAVAEEVLAHGLVPILEPEYSIKAENRASGEEILREEIIRNLNNINNESQIMLKLSLPVVPGSYRPLVEHPNVLKVVALSGGYSRDEACAELARNDGVIASFSRALLDDLRAGASESEFDRTLAEAVEAIFAASTVKARA